MTSVEYGLQPDGEAPINPYSLMESVNVASDSANTAWIIFLGLMAYITIAAAGVSHRDLLVNSPLALPVLQVSIDMTRFFMFAPFVLVLLHLGVLVQHVLLARKVVEFDDAVQLLEASDRRTHPLRLELHSYFFPQALAGPKRSRIMGLVLHGMSWLTLVILPVVLLLYIQVVFLPYHSTAITWGHRIALTIDIVVLVSMGVFLTRIETSFFRAFSRIGRQHPLTIMLTSMVLALVGYFSFFVATVPGEALDRLNRDLSAATVNGTGRDAAFGFHLPMIGATLDGTLFGMFHRNLVVTDLPLVSEKDAQPGEPTLNLRNRDLRYANLARAKLFQADLTGADLGGAILIGADLRNARLTCSNLNALVFERNRPAAGCTNGRDANFTKAKLMGAFMEGVDLQGAKLEEADLEGAVLRFARLTDANFAYSRLDRADVSGGVAMQHANFLLASLQGANLTDGKMQAANLSSASMQGALLARARLQGANLGSTELGAADLSQVKLQLAVLSGAKLGGADLRGAEIWMTTPPAAEDLVLADTTRIDIKAPEKLDLESLTQEIDGLSADVQAQVMEVLGPMLKGKEDSQQWGRSAEFARWQGMLAGGAASQADTYKGQITDYLSKLMCRVHWSNGAIAAGVARRVTLARDEFSFKGDIAKLYGKLKSDECSAAKSLADKESSLLKELSIAADPDVGK